MRAYILLTGFLLFSAMPASAVRITATRIGYVNIERVFDEIKAVEKSREQIREVMDREREEIESGQQAIDALARRLDTQKETLSESEAEELRDMIQVHREKLDELMEESRDRILDKETELKYRILGAIYETVKQISEEKGFTVVLEEDTVLYSTHSVENITDKVINRLNEEYR